MITLRYAHHTVTFDETKPFRPRGRFGSVFKGMDADGRAVIIKQLASTEDPAKINRFRNELELNVQHPNIIQTLGYVSRGKDHFIIREFAEGTDLKRLARKKLPVQFVYHAAVELLTAIDALHEQGVIHRDLKPANVLVTDLAKPAIKLLDLGLAKRKTTPDPQSPFALIYSPPEQLMRYDGLVNESSDLYALGIVLYELLTGVTPFYHPNPELLMNLQLTQKIQAHKRVPEPLFKILQKAASKHPFPKPPSMYTHDEMKELLAEGQSQRYQTANEMLNAIKAIPETALAVKPMWWKFL